MAHEFEVREEITLAATPDEVWQAIATGPGVDSWFFGRTEIEPREGGRSRMTMVDEAGNVEVQEATVAAWEPGRRFSYRSDTSPDGGAMAFEYLVDGRPGGSTVLRFTHSGLLGDDWQREYDALRVSDRFYLEKLAVYLAHFPGRTVVDSLYLPGPRLSDSPLVWERFARVCGVNAEPAVGDGALLNPHPHAFPALPGVVEIAMHPRYLGIRTSDGIFTLVHGYQDMVVIEYNDFGGADIDKIEDAWRFWLEHLHVAV
jgi:uncharacterized protein YndB with AHSA1/START domain